MVANTSVGSGVNSQVEMLESRRLLSVAVHAELHRPQTGYTDFNGDGKADLVVAAVKRAGGGGGGGAGGLVYLQLLANNGDLTFTKTNEVSLGSLPKGASRIHLAVADLDGDRRPDLAYAILSDSGELRGGTLLNGGKGGFSAGGELAAKLAIKTKGTSAKRTDSGLAAGDLDGDGHADLVAWAGGSLVFFAGDGKGGTGKAGVVDNPLYQGSGHSGHNPLFESRIAGVADLDGDGQAELIGFGRSSIRTATLSSIDPLAFSLAKPITSPDVPIDDLLLGDVDGDGAPDLVVISGVQVQFGINAGGKSDIGPIRWMAPESLRLSPNGVTIGDLDGDGLDDLFTVSNALKASHDMAKSIISKIRA